MPDLNTMKTFFELVADKEKEGDVATFARETLENMNQMKTETAAFAQRKQPSTTSFQREYAQS